MQKRLLCPRTELCAVYSIYVQISRDDELGIIEVESIENHDFYSCKALDAVLKLRDVHKLPDESARRLLGLTDCYMTNQANRAVEKRRQDF